MSTQRSYLGASGDRIRLRPAMTDAEIQTAAWRVARKIRSQVRKGADRSDPQTWIDAASRLNCNTLKKKPDGDGEAHYDHRAMGGPAIFYVDAPGEHPHWVAALIVHELAHHVLVIERGSVFPKREERYDDNRATVQHRVSRMAEEILLYSDWKEW